MLVLAAALLLAACGGITSTELAEESQARGGGLGETLPLEAIAVIEEETGDEVLFTSLTLSPGSVSMSIPTPGRDDALDSWIYQSNGNLFGPDPVHGAPPADELRRLLIDPDEIALDQLDEIIDDALAHADLEGGYAQTVGIHRLGERGVLINVSVTSPRETVQVQYRGDGRRREETS